MGTPEQWLEAFVNAAILGGFLYVFVVFPQGKRKNPFPVALWKAAGLVFGSLGSGMIEVFGLHAILHGGLVWIFVASLVAMVLSGVLLRVLRTRAWQLGPA